MSRREFLAQLERLLWDIPVQEREEALEFYNNYFDDAGEENESSVIQELGSPGKVAAIIKADLGESRKEYGEYTETGYSDGIFDDRDMPERAGADKKEKSTGSGEQTQRDGSAYEGRRSYGSRNGFSGQSSTEGSSSQDGTGQYGSGGKGYDGPYSRSGYGTGKSHRNRSGIMWGIIIVFVLFAVPVVGGIGLGILGIPFGLLAGVVGIIAAVMFSGVALLGGGIAMVVYALIHMLGNPAAALAISGAGIIMSAVGILLVMVFILFLAKVVPAVFRWVVDLIQRIMHRGMRGGDRS